MTPNDAFEFFVELVSQLFHADLMAEQAERIEALDAEVARPPAAPDDTSGAADAPQRNRRFRRRPA